MSLYGNKHVSAGACRGRLSWGARGTGCRESPGMGDGDWTQVLGKSSKYSLCRAISPVPIVFIILRKCFLFISCWVLKIYLLMYLCMHNVYMYEFACMFFEVCVGQKTNFRSFRLFFFIHLWQGLSYFWHASLLLSLWINIVVVIIRVSTFHLLQDCYDYRLCYHI